MHEEFWNHHASVSRGHPLRRGRLRLGSIRRNLMRRLRRGRRSMQSRLR